MNRFPKYNEIYTKNEFREKNNSEFVYEGRSQILIAVKLIGLRCLPDGLYSSVVAPHTEL